MFYTITYVMTTLVSFGMVLLLFAPASKPTSSTTSRDSTSAARGMRS
jgi:hypothetical protein